MADEEKITVRNTLLCGGTLSGVANLPTLLSSVPNLTPSSASMCPSETL